MYTQKRQATHFSCAVIFRRTREGVEVLVSESVTMLPRTRRFGKTKLKFPGGMRKGPSETPFETMVREVQEETGLKVNGAERVYSEPSPTAGWRILQHGYLVELDDCTGHLKQGHVFDGGSKLVLKWVSASVIVRGGLTPTHQRVFEVANKRRWRP